MLKGYLLIRPKQLMKGEKKMAKAKNVKAAEPVAKVAKPTEKKAGFPAKEKNSWGHQVGSMGARLDDILEKPTTVEAAAKIISKEFDRDEKAARAKATLHFNWMLKNHPKKIVYDEETKNFSVKK